MHVCFIWIQKSQNALCIVFLNDSPHKNLTGKKEELLAKQEAKFGARIIFHANCLFGELILGSRGPWMWGLASALYRSEQQLWPQKIPPQVIWGSSNSSDLLISEIFQFIVSPGHLMKEKEEAIEEYPPTLQLDLLKLFVPSCRLGSKVIPSSELIV